MTFDNRLNEFNFHLETMNLLKMDNDLTVEETMESVGFSKELTKFLLETNPTYFTGVMLRLKLYAKKNMSNNDVKNELKMHTLLYPLVDYLFMTTDTSVKTVKTVETVKTVKTVKTVETVKPVETVEHVKQDKLNTNLVSDIEEKVVDSDDEDDSENEVNHFDRFYKELVVEDPSGMLKSKEVYESFASWYEDNVDTDVPSKDDLKDYLTSKLGKGDKKGWKGVSLSA